MSSTRPPVRLMRRLRPEIKSVTRESLALFRLGERCNNDCAMCSNSGRPEVQQIATDVLLERADFLAAQGLRQVIVTGGEPTIHPGFWGIVERLGRHGITWDVNTNGRSFADPAFTARATDEGLRRAIVSLHSHVPDVAATISGMGSEQPHIETIRGIGNLIDADVWITISCVLCTHNHPLLNDYV